MTVAVARIRFLTGVGPVAVSFWLLQAFLFLGYTSADEEWEALLALRPRLLLGAIVLLLCGVRLFGRDGRCVRARLESDARLVWLAAFTLASLLSAVWAYDPELARAALTRHLIVMLAYPLVVLLVRTRRELYWTLLVFCAGHGFLVARAYTEYLSGRVDARNGLPRMMGVGARLADPNSFAAAAVFALPLVAWVGARAQSRFVRAGSLAYAALAGVCVILTYSRSGAVLLGLCVVWLLVTLRGRPRLALAAVLSVAAVGAVLRGGDQTSARLSTLVSRKTYVEEESTQGRVDGYRLAWRMAERRPLLGVGPGCWGDYREQRLDGSRLLAHNLWGQILGTRGFLGVFTFAGFLLATLFFGLRLRRRLKDPLLRSLTAPLLFTLLLLLVSGLAAHNLARETWFLVPALLAAAAAVDASSRPAAAGVPSRPAAAGASSCSGTPAGA